MARRSKSTNEGVNLDSLMDALTNVVAVLILVLILVQTQVTQKLSDFFDNLQPATPQEVQESQSVVELLEEEQKRLERLLKQDPPTVEEMAEERAKLAELEKNTESTKSLLVELARLKELEKEARKMRDREQIETTTLQEEIAELEARLEEIESFQPPPPAVVTIPNSRAIPKRAEIYYAFVKQNRVHFIDLVTPQELFWEEIKKNQRELTKEKISQKGADRRIYDQQKMFDHFAGFDFKNSRGQKVELFLIPTDTRVFIDIKPDRGQGGTSLKELQRKNNRFLHILKALQSNRNAVLLFKVDPDSFDAYLLARQLTDQAKVPAGWEFGAPNFHRIHLKELEVHRLEEPAPLPSPGPTPPIPKPPAPPKPPPIGPKLD